MTLSKLTFSITVKTLRYVEVGVTSLYLPTADRLPPLSTQARQSGDVYSIHIDHNHTPGSPNRRKRISSADLLVLASSDKIHFILKL